MSDENTGQSRRDFLRHSLGLVVVAASAPSIALARLEPSRIAYDRAGKIVASYEVRVSDYPALLSIGGSVMLISESELLLNPDHVEWADAGLKRETDAFTCKQGWYPLAVTRVTDSGADAFTVVSTFCPHEAEYQVKFDPLAFIFYCCHQESSFRPDGTWIDPNHPDAKNPDAPSTGTVTRGLRKFAATFDDIDTLTIGLSSSVDDELQPHHLSLGQSVPNPCSRQTVIPFTLDRAGVIELSIHATDGTMVRSFLREHRSAGPHRLTIDTADLEPGVYLYRLQAGERSESRSLVVVR